MPEQKQYYAVHLTGMVPVTLNYRVYAENPQEALQIVERNIMQGFSSAPQIHYARFRKTLGKVFRAGTTLVEFIKNF